MIDTAFRLCKPVQSWSFAFMYDAGWSLRRAWGGGAGSSLRRAWLMPVQTSRHSSSYAPANDESRVLRRAGVELYNLDAFVAKSGIFVYFCDPILKNKNKQR
jgi:hypothetical protein